MTGNTNNNGNNNKPFPGKIAVITSAVSINKDNYHSADRLLAKYGTEKIIHASWPVNFMAETGQIIDIVSGFAEDKDIRTIILNQAYPGSNTAVDKLKETRDDIFIVYCTNHDPTPEAVKRANLLFSTNEQGMGEAMVKQTKKQGAKVFVHYSFPRHTALGFVKIRRKKIIETCAAEGIKFVDAVALDPAGDAGLVAAQQFILEDVPKLVAKYGEDTAFFSTNCTLQAPLVKAVVDCHAIYPQPCCPSPFHGFPEALGINVSESQDDLNYVLSEACRIAEEKNMTDRLSTWPVSAPLMFTNAGAEYAIKWIKGEVPKTEIDNKVLLECMHNYITEVIGEESNVYMTSNTEDGITYNNFKLLLMSYLDF